jgi:hypothetical protein
VPLTPVDPSTLPPALQRILQAPPKLQEMAAKGVAPGVKPADLVLLLVVFAASGASSPVPGLAELAQKTLGALPEPVLQGALGGELAPQALHELAIRHHGRIDVLERLLAAPAIDVETVEEVARIGGEAASELIATNEQRLLEHPRIIELLYMNKNTRMSTADRLVELAVRNRVELNIPAWKEVAAAIGDELIMEASDEPSPDDLLFNETRAVADQLAAEEAAGGGAEVDVFDEDDEVNALLRDKFVPLQKRVAMMTPSQKMRLASLGNKEERMLLVRDSNRLVAVAAVRSPGFSMAEAEKVAGNRSIAEDVLRVIGGTPEFTQSYVVKKSLAENPKTPIAIATKLIVHLRESDLRAIARSKNVTGPVQDAARRHLERRKR